MKIIKTLGLALAVALGASQVSAKNLTLRFSSFLPQNHWYIQNHILPLMSDIEKVTEGRVKIELLPKVVGTALGQFDVVRDGLADLAYIIPAYTPGRFVLAEMGELPLLGDDPTVMSPAFTKIYREQFEKYGEFKGVKPLAIYTVVPVGIFNLRHPITKIEDFKGLKVRSPGNVPTEVLKLLGGVPILKSSAEVYEMLSTGAIDGQISVTPVLVAGNTAGFTKYATYIPGGLANSVHMIGINADKWNEISPEDRKVIETTVIPAFTTSIAAAWKTQDLESKKALQDSGYRIDIAEKAMTEAFRNATKPIEENWVKQAKAKGLPNPEEVLRQFRAEIAK